MILESKGGLVLLFNSGQMYQYDGSWKEIKHIQPSIKRSSVSMISKFKPIKPIIQKENSL